MSGDTIRSYTLIEPNGLGSIPVLSANHHIIYKKEVFPPMSEATKTSRRHQKSRNYPLFDLKEAIDQAKVLQQREGFGWMPQKSACSHWNLSATGSTGKRTISALIQYRLLETEGKGDARQVRLSQVAKEILHPDPSAAKAEASKEAVIGPTVFRELFEKYPDKLPSNETLVFNLTKDGEFSDDAALRMIETYRATMEFAGLTKREFAGLTKSRILGVEGNDKPTDNNGKTTTETPSGVVPTSEGSSTMPVTDAPNRRDFDLPIQLSAGLQGTLRLPVPMTPTEWEKFKTAISNVEQLKPFLVCDDLPERNGAGSPANGSEAGS